MQKKIFLAICVLASHLLADEFDNAQAHHGMLEDTQISQFPSHLIIPFEMTPFDHTVLEFFHIRSRMQNLPYFVEESTTEDPRIEHNVGVAQHLLVNEMSAQSVDEAFSIYAYWGLIEQMRWVLSDDSTFHPSASSMQNALNSAARNNQVEALQLLINGNFVFEQSIIDSAFYAAARNSFKEAMEWMLSDDCSQQPSQERVAAILEEFEIDYLDNMMNTY